MSNVVRSLGYLGLNTALAPAWDDLLQGVFALEKRTDSGARVHQYKMDENHHRLSIYEAGEEGLANIGWEVVDAAAVEEAANSLAKAGVTAVALTRDECGERAILGGCYFHDPIMQVRNELYYGATVESQLFQPARAMNGYVTGDQGMGHIVLMTDRQEDAVAFYCDVLGFKVSDIMDFGGEQWGGAFRHVFLHCNSRHHSLAIMSPPPEGSQGALNHLALTVKDFDDIGYAYDIVRKEGIPVLMTLGKHVNDLATSFYVGNPSQSAIEMTYGGVEVGDDWTVAHYDDTKIWGHHVYLPPKPLS